MEKLELSLREGLVEEKKETMKKQYFSNVLLGKFKHTEKLKIIVNTLTMTYSFNKY